MPARPAVLLLLLALALLAPRPSAAGAPKLDLTSYLAADSQVGDYKVFSDGAEGTRRSELVYEEVFPKVRIEIVELELDGEPAGATSYAVQPGRSARLLAVVAAGLEMRFPRGLAMRLRVQPGKWIESGAGGKAFVGDVRVGKARIRREWRFVGFESVDIPGASFPEAARTEERTSIVVKERGGGRRIEVRTSSVGFSVEGWGLVASEENVATWIDGVLVEETGPSRWSLVEGTIFGQSIPWSVGCAVARHRSFAKNPWTKPDCEVPPTRQSCAPARTATPLGATTLPVRPPSESVVPLP